jgi:hypothetical protein
MNDRKQTTTYPEPRDERLTTADLARGTQVEQPIDTIEELQQTEPVKPTAMPESNKPMALFAPEDTKTFRARWVEVQTGFVDEPRRAVEDADNLVAELMKRMAETFASERANLENQWNRGANVSTEDLRLTLQRYRSFFDSLLSL